jgi:hypothetical protein
MQMIPFCETSIPLSVLHQTSASASNHVWPWPAQSFQPYRTSVHVKQAQVFGRRITTSQLMIIFRPHNPKIKSYRRHVRCDQESARCILTSSDIKSINKEWLLHLKIPLQLGRSRQVDQVAYRVFLSTISLHRKL